VIHQPESLELGGWILLAGEHQLARAPQPDQPGQQERGAELRHHAHAREEETHLRVGGGEPDVAEQRHRASHPEGIPVDRRDCGLRHLLHEGGKLLDATRAVAPRRAGAAASPDLPGEELHVRPGTEGPPRPGEDDGPHVAVAIGGAERVEQLATHDGSPGVQALRTVERDRRDAVGALEADRLEVHAPV
jgi:hypothetical protein